MLKGLTEARRQLLTTYPAREGMSEEKWVDAITDWAVLAYAKLLRLGPIQEQRAIGKPPAVGVKSLTKEELDAVKKAILKCTDLKQLQDLRQLFFVHFRSLVQRFRRW